MTRAWREAGAQSEAVSSRIVRARLKLARHNTNRGLTGRIFTTSVWSMSLLSVCIYAPTHRSEALKKKEFLDTLYVYRPPLTLFQRRIYILVVMRDCNARVECCEKVDI